MNPNYAKTKYTCYFSNLAMASAFCLPPILFLTFREMYGISYTLLGTLVLINFCTQLLIDLIFSFFSRHFSISVSLKVMPLLTAAGLIVYALIPTLFPEYAYPGLVLGTILFSTAAGLCEVLTSPVIAALPSENPKKDMTTLHSLYGYGVVLVAVLSTLFLELFGNRNWMILVLLWAIPPLIASYLFTTSPLPEMSLSHGSGEIDGSSGNYGILFCILIIFFGSAAENTMTNWISGYIEQALQLPKAVGDILGLTLFAVLLAGTRTWYANYGKNIERMLLVSMGAAALCYLAISLSPSPVLSMFFCVLTGIFTAMLWPGTLIYMEEKIPHAGVAAYALMAAGGDFGASLAPQSLGIIVDKVAASDWGISVSQMLTLSPEQLGMKIGMLAAAVFPILGFLVLTLAKRYFTRTLKGDN